MENQIATEKRSVKETPLQKLSRSFAEFGRALIRILLLSLIFTPVLILSFLTVDLPFRAFDRFFIEPALRPSVWLGWGMVTIAVAPLISILFARRYGGDEAARVITASWGVAALLVLVEISILAPSLDVGDFPPVRFVVGFVVSAMSAQYFAPAIYDVTRGGGAWWRAPLYSAMSAYGVGAMIYYPVIYWDVEAPWVNWMIGDLAIKLLIALLFLPVYHFCKKFLRPRGGYGGGV